ncbi:hypothetical protein CBM2591_B80129 [Cupriavidus taiwanensis]|nr:hypothetical protein CBM2591_B80129 [Cupriavidus taiwanensis]SOZ93685.1 hypothetical protein CBM2621_B120018 [Cupriavidus taiwanensis]
MHGASTRQFEKMAIQVQQILPDIRHIIFETKCPLRQVFVPIRTLGLKSRSLSCHFNRLL